MCECVWVCVGVGVFVCVRERERNEGRNDREQGKAEMILRNCELKGFFWHASTRYFLQIAAKHFDGASPKV